MIALSVAAALAVFVVYTALAGNGIADLTPSTVGSATGHVALIGKVVGTPHGDAYTKDGLRFRVKDIGKANAKRVLVDYRGSVPDLFKPGRDIIVDGRMRNGVFVATPGSLVTKCPSHYAPAKSSSKT